MNKLDELEYSQPYKKKKSMEEDNEEKPLIIAESNIYVFMGRLTKYDKQKRKQIVNFVKQICDPNSKAQKIHQYEVTKQSLIRARALGYTKERINKKLSEYAGKYYSNQIRDKIAKYIEKYEKCGNGDLCQLRLSWMEQSCSYIFVIQEQLYNQLKRESGEKFKKIEEEFLSEKIKKGLKLQFAVKKNKHIQLYEKLLEDCQTPIQAEREVRSFQPAELYRLKGARRIAYCHNIQINLKSFTQLRQYQAQALNSIVKAQKQSISAKSGYVVLPCGAGKTLLGISILCKIKKETLIVCSSDSGTEQWKRQIQKWTQSFPLQQIIIITSENKYDFKNSVKGQIFISTYTFLKTHINQKTDIEHKDMWIVSKPWGLVIFDECQTLPAQQNRQIVQTLYAQVKIGLTATPLRQDNQIKNLNFMIGPQLYTGDWKMFVQHGYLANPKCIEVRTQLTPYFNDKFNQYNQSRVKRQLCYKINPNKVKALLYLLHEHQKLNDHILVFSDDISILTFLSRHLQKPVLQGSSKIEQRMFIFDMFRQGKIKTLFLSRIGDEAIDLPNANVGIEINIQHGSRKQMLQRLGRIMRQKEASSSMSYNAIFYTITTYKTDQWRYFFKRYRYLIDEGFQYDLRLFEFKDNNFDNSLKFDKETKQEVEQKFKNMIGNYEERYWNLMCQSHQKEKDYDIRQGSIGDISTTLNSSF